MTPEHKADVLRHCLWMAERDPEYAVWAAGWYEGNEPELLRNLQAKVQQEVRRRSTSGPPSRVEVSTNERTPKPRKRPQG